MLNTPPPIIQTGKTFTDIKKSTELGETLDSSAWVDCSFRDCELSGVDIMDAVFTKCHFQNVSFYWCSAFKSVFIDCKFENCDLRGNFNDAKFIRCGIIDCAVGDNELGGITVWEDAISHETVVSGQPLPIIRGS